MTTQPNLGMEVSGPGANDPVDVEKVEFEPIKGYPMLNWRGKRPFRSTHFYPAQLKEVHGGELDCWRNRIFWGDNLQVMGHLLKHFRGKVNLVYIDPPFDSKADYKKKIQLRGKSAVSDTSAFEEKQYTDIWTNDEYLQFMYERLVLIRELMHERGSIYLHCDYRRSHMLKLIMDEVFGGANFINEIIWVRTSSHNMKSRGFVRSNDHLLFYSKTKDFTFNEQFTSYSEAQLARYRPDENGKLYKAENLTFSTANPERQFNWRGTQPPPNRSWGMSLERLEQLWSEGRILKKADGSPRMDGWKIYLDDMKGNPLSTNWTDLTRIGNTSSERLDYPTQKPEQLLERILTVSSDPGDLVFDCFMGSGTTQAVAMKLGRRFIGADINLGAVQTTTRRLIRVAQGIIGDGASSDKNRGGNGEFQFDDLDPEIAVASGVKLYTGFEVFNVNHYDVFRNPVQARDLLLEALEIQTLADGSLFDGEKDGRLVKIMPVDRIATRADLTPLISGFDYKAFERRQAEDPRRPVEQITLVCMGHEPDLAATLKGEVKPYELDVEVVDILRDRGDLQFKRDSEARVTMQDGQLTIAAFYPMNLLQKLSLEKEKVEDWREMVDSVMIDWNYDGAIFSPVLVDIPEKNVVVEGCYQVPPDAGTIRVKITDVLSESLEVQLDG